MHDASRLASDSVAINAFKSSARDYSRRYSKSIELKGEAIPIDILVQRMREGIYAEPGEGIPGKPGHSKKPAASLLKVREEGGCARQSEASAASSPRGTPPLARCLYSKF